MNTEQIDCTLRSDPLTRRTYLGCFPINCIPDVSSKNAAAFVLNSDPSDMPGEHWVCINICDSMAVFFDSFALPPSIYSDTLHELVYDKPNVWVNQTRLQSGESNLCGQYCIYALRALAEGLSPNRLLHPFSDNLTQNDRWIAQQFEKDILTERYPRVCNLRNVVVQVSRTPKTTSIYATYLV